jgi:hypothetical protein
MSEPMPPLDQRPGEVDPRVRLELITPERARQLMALNTDNRPLRDIYTRTLATMMKASEWHLTHQGIAIREDGVLADGQHRLAAIIASGVPQWVYVTYDLTLAAAKAIDRGRIKSIPDLMHVPRAVLQPIMFLHGFMARNPIEREMTVARILPLYGALSEAAVRVHEACPTARRRLSTAAVRAAATLCARDRDAEHACRQYRALILTRPTEMAEPTLALFRWAAEQRVVVHQMARETFLRALPAFDAGEADRPPRFFQEPARRAALARIKAVIEAA